MNKKELIIIREQGDPLRKWIKVAMSQIISELEECPCCGGDNTVRYAAVDTYYRCSDCTCCWAIDYDKVREIARVQVEEEQARSAAEFEKVLNTDYSAQLDALS